jgi:diguanylate cyclase (GGDEF)-like protein
MSDSTMNKLIKEQVSKKVHLELVDILYKQLKHMLWAEAFAATLLLFILWWSGDRGLLIDWYAYMILVTGMPRYYLASFYSRKPHLYEDCKKWEVALAFLLVMTGLGWSFIGTVLLPKHNVLNQAIVLFLLIGVASAANPFYSPLKKIYAVFLIPTLFIPAAYLMFKDSNLFIFTGIAVLSFGLLMLITSIFSSNLIETALNLRFQNRLLADNLIKSNQSLEKLASQDTLTGLANRQAFSDQLSKAIISAKSTDQAFALMFLDVDKFKYINDTYGHDAGDEVLLVITQRFNQCLRSGDASSRLGGDEFMLLFQNISSPEMVANLAERVCEAVAQPILFKKNTLAVSVSVGISLFPVDGDDEETLIKHADIAMYQSKKQSSGRFQFFDSLMNERIFKK